MENQGPLVLDISSDEETVFGDARKGGAYDKEDVDWLSNLLTEVSGNVDDDSDDVVFLSELFPKTLKKSISDSLKPSPKVDDDDEECMILDVDPDSQVFIVNNKVDDDCDDLEIIGEKGEVACRDFPHARHLCAKYLFSSTPHEVHCGQCHCYVCDLLAPCPHWGTGANSIDHCHASDKEEYWKTERKHVKKSDNHVKKSEKPVPRIRSRIGSFFQSIQVPGCSPSLSNSLSQTQGCNPVTTRPCALSSNVSLPNAMSRVRSQLPGNVAPRLNSQSQLMSVQSHPRSTNTVVPRVALRNKDHPVGRLNHHQPLASVLKRHGIVAASTNNKHVYRSQLGNPPLNRHPVSRAPAATGNRVSDQRILGSQGAVPVITQTGLSSHNMDNRHPVSRAPATTGNRGSDQRILGSQGAVPVITQTELSSHNMDNRHPVFRAPATTGNHGSDQRILGSQVAVPVITQTELSSHNMGNRHPVFLAPATTGNHGSDQCILGSQGAVPVVTQTELSSHNMDARCANYLPPEAQLKPQLYSNPDLIPHQSQPFAIGNSISSPLLKPYYVSSQPSVGNTNCPATPEPYIPFMPNNHVPPQNAASWQSVAGNTFSDRWDSRSTISLNSSVSNVFGKDSSQLQGHCDPTSSLTCKQNDVQYQYHTQGAIGSSPADFGLFCDSSIDNGNKQMHVEESQSQSQYPSTAPAEASQIQNVHDQKRKASVIVDDLPQQRAKKAAARTSTTYDQPSIVSVVAQVAAADTSPTEGAADCQLPESGDPPGSLDFHFLENWMLENQSFTGAVEASALPNWDTISSEAAFADTGALFDS